MLQEIDNPIMLGQRVHLFITTKLKICSFWDKGRDKTGFLKPN